MSKAKQVAVDLIERMPEGSTTADIMVELYFKEQIDKGLKDVTAGQVFSHELLKERHAAWRSTFYSTSI